MSQSYLSCRVSKPYFLCLLLCSIAIAFTAYAEPKQRGLLSATGSTGYGNITIPEPFDGDITGGVSLSKDECSYSVTNTSKDSTIRFSVEINEFMANGKKGRSTSGSHLLKAGESDSRTIRVRARTLGCSLWVTRWRSDKKKVEEEEPEEDSNNPSGEETDPSGSPSPEPQRAG